MNVIISQSRALELLGALGDGENIRVQKRLISQLDPTEKLVVSRKIKPYSAVNVSTYKGDNGRVKTTKIHTSLPLVYPYDPAQPYPEVIQAKPRKDRTMKPRSDKKLEEYPFLPAISAYRYKR